MLCRIDRPNRRGRNSRERLHAMGVLHKRQAGLRYHQGVPHPQAGPRRTVRRQLRRPPAAALATPSPPPPLRTGWRTTRVRPACARMMWSLRPSSRNLAGPPPGLLATHPRRHHQMHLLGRRHPALRHRRRRQPVRSTYLHIQRRRASRTVWHRPASTARMSEGIRSPRPRCRSLRPDQRHDAIALPPTETTTRPTTERLPTAGDGVSAAH